MSGITGDFRSVQLFSDLFTEDTTSSYAPRVYKLRRGDIVVVNAVGFENCFKIKIKDVNLGRQPFHPNFICLEKVKRKKWWRFWEPKYVAARLMYIGEGVEEIK